MAAPFRDFGPLRGASTSGSDFLRPNTSKRRGLLHLSIYGDALDAWKPELSKLFGIPESQVGKIVLPSFVAAKWISENEVLIDLESSFTDNKNFDDFEFSLRALVGADGKTLSTKFQRGPAAQ